MFHDYINYISISKPAVHTKLKFIHLYIYNYISSTIFITIVSQLSREGHRQVTTDFQNSISTLIDKTLTASCGLEFRTSERVYGNRQKKSSDKLPKINLVHCNI